MKTLIGGLAALMAVILAAPCASAQELVVEYVGSYDTPDQAMDVFVAGNYAYVADYWNGLQIVNVANPTNPVLAGSYDTPNWTHGVFVAGNYAYVADGFSGLWILNVSNPASPVLAGNYDTPDWALSVFVAGNYAYVADGWSGLQIVNVSNPANPVLAGSYDTPGQAFGVFVAGSYAYVADDESGLQIVNISDPANPMLAGNYDTPGYAFGVFVAGNHAYVADAWSGLQIVDVSNPANPVLAGSYDTPSSARGVFVVGDYAYVADYSSGLQIVNVSNPASPVLAGSYDTPGVAWGVCVAGYYAYVADGVSGLQILRWRPRLAVTAPNGGEHWRIFENGTVRWMADSAVAAVRIELNRNYPSGPWEVLADSTADDGEHVVFVTDPISDHCRVRVSAIGGSLADISDADFSIVSLHGYLALVRVSAPTVPVLSWNAGVMECPASAVDSFRLKNFGTETIIVFRPLEPPSEPFSRTTTCGALFVLSPGQMSWCNLQLRFQPQDPGMFNDTLLIQTDAINNVDDFVRIPLTGTQTGTPVTPQIVISSNYPHARLDWPPVTQSVGGCEIASMQYLIFISESSSGPYGFHGATADTFYLHPLAVQNATAMYYHVVAVTSPQSMVEELVPGMREEEVLALIK